jgi:hypothetical protein
MSEQVPKLPRPTWVPKVRDRSRLDPVVSSSSTVPIAIRLRDDQGGGER